MKANELMIGDWVEVIDSDHLKYVKVRNILDISIVTERCEYESEVINLINIKPILLTAEILEKNGWEKSSITDYKWSALYEGNRLPDMWEDTNKHYLMVIGLIDVNINYIHELQHALKQYKIDKQIEL